MSNYKINTLTTSEDKILQGKGYRLYRQIGEGGYAKVLFSPDITQLKLLPSNFVKEFILVHESRHAILRHAELGDLLEYVLRYGAIGQDQARVWTRQIALAIQYLHILDIAHRDLKCENILITANHNVKVSDFGFAKFTTGEDKVRKLSETYCGSLSYAPPEILKGEPYNAKIADMWSFGILIYTMLNRANPFDSKNVKILYQNQLQKKWKFRTRYAEKVSEEAVILIGYLLEPDLYKRYRIENVLTSSWILMDPKLKVLSPSEFGALSAAMEEAKSSSRTKSIDDDSKRRRHSSAGTLRKMNPNRNSLTFYKEYDGGFDLQHIKSDYNKQDERLSK